MPDTKPSPLIPIEKKKFFCIEYPGYVKRTKRAIETLGGEAALSEALSNNYQIQLKYRAKDIFSHSINGDILDTCKLLVKVTRRVKRNKRTGEVVEEGEEEDASWQPHILGIVEKTVRFRSLADFQYIVPKDDKIRRLKEALKIGDVDTIMNYKVPNDDEDFNNLRNIPPPAFTAIEAPFSYGYKQNASVLRVRVRQPDGSFKIKLVNRSKTTSHQITAIKYDDENVPSKSWHNLKEPETEVEREAIEAVAGLFKDRPIWSRLAIRHNLDVKYHKLLVSALVHNAYTFHTGPWRDCWVRYGLDPRKDQKYHIYQQIDIRRVVKEGEQQRVTTRKSKPTKAKASGALESLNSELVPNQHIFDGKIMPGSSSMYQLCDIIEPDIAPLIRNQGYLKPSPTKYTGFYYKCVFERIRKTLKQKRTELLNNGSATHIKNAGAGLVDEIAKEIATQKDEEGYEEEEDAIGTDFEKAAIDAMKAMSDNETSTKRLQQIADEYVDQLESANATMSNEFENIDDADLDVIDTLEEFDDEELDDAEEDTSNQQQQIINEDVEMKD